MASTIDDGVLSAINGGVAKEAAAVSDTRTRMWDNFSLAAAGAQINYINMPSVNAGQGIRMLNGTPGQFANAVPAGGTP